MQRVCREEAATVFQCLPSSDSLFIYRAERERSEEERRMNFMV